MMHCKRLPVAVVCCLLSLAVSGALTPGTSQTKKSIILATTTSTYDSGLLDALMPVFERDTGYAVKTISVGSGQALKMGERGEADVLLVHSPDAEMKLVERGAVLHRRTVMHNDFVIVGPSGDPAGIRGLKSAGEAFRKIAEAGAPFFSRGDNSGTHELELKLWKSLQLQVEEKAWYRQTGLGMGQTLNVTAEKKAYTLADRGTYVSLKKTLGLDILVEGDAMLLNIYHVLEVNPEIGANINREGGKALADFLVSPKAQSIIKTFGVRKFGAPLFFPDAVRGNGEAQ